MEIIRGVIPCAKKVVIYGPEGIGKSTFASRFPDPVFIDTEGSTNSKKLGESANVTNVHPHRYRRTLATNLLDRGANIQDVAAVLGHADLKTTQVYCYISQSNVRASYNKYSA